MRVQSSRNDTLKANPALMSETAASAARRYFTDSEAEQPLTGCCSALSTLPCSQAEDEETWHPACFEDNQDYASTQAHATVSREEVLQCMSSYHGLCLSDEQLDEFVETQDAIGPSVETMLLSHSAE